MTVHHLERAAIEELFQLQRRAAITLMKQAGAEEVRGSLWVDRATLIAWVQRIVSEEAWQLERRRATNEELNRAIGEVQAVREAVSGAGREIPKFPIVDKVLQATCTSLPPEVTLSPGKIEIYATDARRACEVLYELAMAMTNDFDTFAATLEVDQVTMLQSQLASVFPNGIKS
jgi:hypothetical protein